MNVKPKEGSAKRIRDVKNNDLVTLDKDILSALVKKHLRLVDLSRLRAVSTGFRDTPEMADLMKNKSHLLLAAGLLPGPYHVVRNDITSMPINAFIGKYGDGEHQELRQFVKLMEEIRRGYYDSESYRASGEKLQEILREGILKKVFFSFTLGVQKIWKLGNGAFVGQVNIKNREIKGLCREVDLNPVFIPGLLYSIKETKDSSAQGARQKFMDIWEGVKVGADGGVQETEGVTIKIKTFNADEKITQEDIWEGVKVGADGEVQETEGVTKTVKTFNADGSITEEVSRERYVDE